MHWFAFRMSGLGGQYVPERIVNSGPGWYATGTPEWSHTRWPSDGKAFATEGECLAWIGQQQGRR